MAGALKFREIDSSVEGRAALTRFYRGLYIAEFPDPHERESLVNMRRYLALKAKGWYGPNNYHILIMELNGRPVGGSVFDYLARPNAGVIEFLFTRSTYRSRGFGKALLGATLRALRRDARARTGRSLAAVVAEMNDPYRRMDTPDNMDPFERAAIWGKWGFSKMEFPYVQPALSPDQRPVRCLTLVAKPLRRVPRAGFGADWALGVVGEYMRWAMRIRDPSRNAQYRDLAHFAAKNSRVRLVPLQTYVGRDPRKELRVEKIGPRHVAFRSLHRLLSSEIPFAGRVASIREFESAFARGHRRVCRYHLWSVARSGARHPEGLASFFTLTHAGFGGYIVLASRLRGRGLLRPLIARIEEQMIKDQTPAEGWFIECDEGSMLPFVATGFREVPIEFRPPKVGGEPVRNGHPERLRLLYKPFGNPFDSKPLDLPFVLAGIADILREIYEVPRPRKHECYRLAQQTWKNPKTVLR